MCSVTAAGLPPPHLAADPTLPLERCAGVEEGGALLAGEASDPLGVFTVAGLDTGDFCAPAVNTKNYVVALTDFSEMGAC
ncbi:hypothetical protein GH5_06819 [Leishmania sp. Ghana 2012 LV757]|uniref:hypothetical protein n=1 Tax=Leishmania sp. Ghana 2012 LV757 TaxID=2803181 RepID=UPI001B401CB9|nr:hypothetical protein GH5_06819 [Leishmania sp. Ghana 2012 LV757]